VNDPTCTDILQTVAVVAALVFTGWEIRGRAHEQKFRNYLDGMSGFIDLARLMVEKPELHALYEYSSEDICKTYEELSPEQKSRVHYCDTIIALCEPVWVASEQRWIAKDEWPHWINWIHDLNGAPEFRWTLKWIEGEYDDEFVKALRAPADTISRPTTSSSPA
jgi:hypothetical protein